MAGGDGADGRRGLGAVPRVLGTYEGPPACRGWSPIYGTMGDLYGPPILGTKGDQLMALERVPRRRPSRDVCAALPDETDGCADDPGGCHGAYDGREPHARGAYPGRVSRVNGVHCRSASHVQRKSCAI